MHDFSWEQLEHLSAQYGESFYLLDLSRFQANYQAFLQAFQAVYAKSQIAYSYKTNYTPRLCQLVRDYGGYAEVVSGMEYGLALKIGVAAQRIIFNGPYKQENDLTHALLSGSVVNLDSVYEVEQVKILAARFPRYHFRLGLRCNFDIGVAQRSRFGFDVNSADFTAIAQSLRELPNCRIVGLHCHFLAPERSATAYANIAQRMLQLALNEFAQDELAFIDIGGGFYSSMPLALQQQFAHPIPSFNDYGAAIAGVFARQFPQHDGPELILEPGLALVADAMQFVAKTIDVKNLGQRQVALVAGSIYDIKPTLNTRNLPLNIVASPGESLSNQGLDIVGYTCMENDCLYSAFDGSLKRRDYVVFDNVGAYTTVLRPPFIYPAPPILARTADGSIEVLRRRDTPDDVFAAYSFNEMDSNAI